MLNQYLSQDFWQYIFLGNTVEKYIYATLIFIGTTIVFKIFQTILIHRLQKLAQKTKTDIDDTLVEIINSVRPRFYSFLSFYVALKTLSVNHILAKAIEIVLIVWIVYQIINAVQILIDYIVHKKIKEENESEAKNAVNIISLITKATLWCLGLMLILSNLGIDITSLIAGLGIGGIAVALALQNILSDLFSSFAIYFDKPFTAGDFIIVGDKMGTVERIGVKSTRIRSIQGEELIISNKELTTAQIQNYKKMKERRVAFPIGVTYGTPTKKLEKIPGIIEKIVGEAEKARFDRTHFKNFGSSSLDFEIVYFVESGDYAEYMDINHKINLNIKKAFEKEDISFAYPTQTIYLNK